MAEEVYDFVVERNLLVEVEVADEKGVVDVAIAELRDQLRELGLDLGEDARHLGGWRATAIYLETIRSFVAQPRLVGRVARFLLF